MGIAAQMPVTPSVPAVRYARATRVPSETTVSTTDIAGFFTAR